MKLETAEEFARRLTDIFCEHDSDAQLDTGVVAMAAAVEADRNAVRLALIDELERRVCGRPQCGCWVKVLEMMRAEYAKPEGAVKA